MAAVVDVQSCYICNMKPLPSAGCRGSQRLEALNLEPWCLVTQISKRDRYLTVYVILES
jgi:hypothetical protein